MVMIVAPLVGVAALLARVSVTAAVPMDYGSGSYVLYFYCGHLGDFSSLRNFSSSSMAAPPSYTSSGQYGSSSSSSSYNSGSMYAPPPPPPSYTSSSMSSSYGSGSMSWNNGGYDSCVQRKLPLVLALTWLIPTIDRMCGSVRHAIDHVHASLHDC
jgi:hypothetical protein